MNKLFSRLAIVSLCELIITCIPAFTIRISHRAISLWSSGWRLFSTSSQYNQSIRCVAFSAFTKGVSS